jgi:biopolymer transport protein ExbD
MAKVKIKKHSTFIDMTAMSDVTVLLLTFFMVSSTFTKKEPVEVTPPASISDFKVPENNVLSILVDNTGKVFMGFDRQEDQSAVLEAVGEEYGMSFTPTEIKKFGLLHTFGVNIKQMKSFLSLKEEKMDEVLATQGIPADSTDNQFKVWVKQARTINPDLTIAIKADSKTPYKVIKDVMNSLQALKENRYSLITSLKTDSEE